MINALINTLRQFWNNFSFKGRTRRKDFWMAILTNALLILALILVSFCSWLFLIGVFGRGPTIGLATILLTILALLGTFATFVYVVALLMPTLAISARRLHDIGLSGWWLLPIILANILKSVLNDFFDIWTPILDVLHFAIIVGTIVVFSIPSQPFTNRYGENPLEKSPLESKTTSSDENSK